MKFFRQFSVAFKKFIRWNIEDFPQILREKNHFKNYEFLTAWLPLQDLNVFPLDAGRPPEVALAVIGPVVAAADGIFRLLVLVTDHPGVAVCNM